MKPCKNCACMVIPGDTCFHCGAKSPVIPPMPTRVRLFTVRDGKVWEVDATLGRREGETYFETYDEALRALPSIPSRSDEGFDLLGQVGRVRRKTR